MRIYIFSSKFYLPITAKAFKFAILNYYLLEVYITQGKLQLINMKSVFFFTTIIFYDKVFISLPGKNKTKQNQNPQSMKQLQLLSLGSSYRERFCWSSATLVKAVV